MITSGRGSSINPAWKPGRGILSSIASVALAAVALCQHAFAFEELKGQVVAEQTCQAFVSFRKLTNPDGAKLAAGTTYQVVGRNQAGGEWLQILLPQAQPQQRWIAVGCGRLVADSAPPAEKAAGLPPFFDDVQAGPEDPSPPAPPLDAFDQAVLGVCGAWGSRPRAAAFRAMLDRPELTVDLDAIYAQLDHAVRGRAIGLPRFKDELTAVWFERGGFTHVFCGEPASGGLGGLHYRGRYYDLQQQGVAGLMSASQCRATVIEPPVYTVGVLYRPPGGGALRSACPKGYPDDLGARDLLVAATRAYRQLRLERGQRMCLQALGGTDAIAQYRAVLVIEGDAIRTFYPDATPACDGGGRPASCNCDG